MAPTTRTATHAGSWYDANKGRLSDQLDNWLSQVPDQIDGLHIPQPKARVIIAPHAGYSYSGSTAAFAYKSIDVSQAKRVFLLGPSHHFYLTGCALSSFKYYSTPLGDIRLDTDIIAELDRTHEFDQMVGEVDEEEHSLELHLPYIRKVLPDAKLVPILVGNTNADVEATIGKILAPYLNDASNVFVISSDFAHWGTRFRYTKYISSPEAVNEIRSLRQVDEPVRKPSIHESIGMIDQLTIESIESGSPKTYRESLKTTGNTVCGRHPIGIIMEAIRELIDSRKIKNSKFHFVRYARSSDCVKVSDSSVSYASAYAVIEHDVA